LFLSTAIQSRNRLPRHLPSPQVRHPPLRQQPRQNRSRYMSGLTWVAGPTRGLTSAISLSQTVAWPVSRLSHAHILPPCPRPLSCVSQSLLVISLNSLI